MWENGIRGCKSRLIRGLDLFSRYRDVFNLTLLLTPYTKEKAKKNYEKNKNSQRVFNILSNFYSLSEEYNFDKYLKMPNIYINEIEKTEDDNKRLEKIYNLDTYNAPNKIHVHTKTLAWIFRGRNLNFC
jgi:hypothetical protein